MGRVRLAMTRAYSNISTTVYTFGWLPSDNHQSGELTVFEGNPPLSQRV